LLLHFGTAALGRVIVANTAAASRARTVAATALLFGVAVALSIGVYAHVHHPSLRPLYLFGFSGMLQMKTWLATIALVLVLVQLLSALWMWGRLPGVSSTPGWVAWLHRWSGTIAFVVSLPVALHCIWSLGFETGDARVLAHSAFGCAFYGAYAAKMLGLRLHNGPKWLLPVLGGAVFTFFVLIWLTSAVWFFTRSGLPLT
jgi:hypothetical protein